MRIAALINLKGYTIGQFASAVGVSEERMIDIIQSGKTDIQEFWNMAKVLDMSCDDLYKCLRPLEAEKTGKTINIPEGMKRIKSL